MKIRTLLAGVALASGAAATFATPALAWECPKNLTRAYYVTTPTGETRVCVPDLNCEQCFVDVR